MYFWPYIERLIANMFVVFLLYINIHTKQPRKKILKKYYISLALATENTSTLEFECMRNGMNSSKRRKTKFREKKVLRKVPNICAMMNMLIADKWKKKNHSINPIIRSWMAHKKQNDDSIEIELPNGFSVFNENYVLFHNFIAFFLQFFLYNSGKENIRKRAHRRIYAVNSHNTFAVVTNYRFVLFHFYRSLFQS